MNYILQSNGIKWLCGLKKKTGPKYILPTRYSFQFQGHTYAYSK